MPQVRVTFCNKNKARLLLSQTLLATPLPALCWASPAFIPACKMLCYKTQCSIKHSQSWVRVVQACPRQTSLEITDCDCLHLARTGPQLACVTRHGDAAIIIYNVTTVVLQDMCRRRCLPELHPQTVTLQLDSNHSPSKTRSTPPHRRI